MAVIFTWPDDSGATVSMSFDVDTSEAHNLTNLITEFPVETGSNIADHVVPQLNQFTIEGFVSDTPIASNPGVDGISEVTSVELQVPEPPSPGITAPGRALVGAISGLIAGAVPKRATLLTFADFKSRIRAVMDLLEDARVNARLIRIVTSLKEYDDMVIESLSPSRTPEMGSTTQFVLTLKEVKFVTSETVDAPVPTEAIGAVPKAVGSKAGKDAKGGEKRETLRSTLKGGFDAGSELLGF
jgi:hypothetical protein